MDDSGEAGPRTGRDVAPASPWRRAPWGVVGMLALVLLAERSVARRGMEVLTPDEWVFRDARQMAAKQARDAQVLGFGDSLLKLAMIPRVVGERSGRRVVSLAVSGGQPVLSESLFRRALASGARPEAVVVDFFPPLLKLPPQHNQRFYPLVLTPAETARAAWDGGNPDLFTAAAAQRLLPSLLARASLRGRVLAALNGEANLQPWSNMTFRRNWRVNAGAQLMLDDPAKTAGLTDEAAEKWRAQYFDRIDCGPAHSAAIRRFLDLAASHGVRVYWLLPPYVPKVQDRCEASGFDAAHRAFVRGWQARYSNVTVIDARRAAPDPAGYFDPHHLGATGAHGFSLALGDLLRKDLPARRAGRSGAAAGDWLTLAPFRPRPLPEGVEDVNLSALALQQPGGRAAR